MSWGCYKLRYPDQQNADDSLARLQGKSGHGERRSYFCFTCRGYHLTSQVERALI